MPSRYRILLAKRVAADLQQIFDHIAKDSPTNATTVVRRILGAIDSLSLFPHRTVVEHQDPRLKHPVRSLPVQSWVMYFRVLEEQQVVRVLHIRHGSRRPPKPL